MDPHEITQHEIREASYRQSLENDRIREAIDNQTTAINNIANNSSSSSSSSSGESFGEMARGVWDWLEDEQKRKAKIIIACIVLGPSVIPLIGFLFWCILAVIAFVAGKFNHGLINLVFTGLSLF